MGLNCGCPIGVSLTPLADQGCKSSFGQIQKILFQRTYKGVRPNIIRGDDIGKLSNWSTLIGADDSAAVTVSPELSNPEFTPGEARTFGGGNQTPGGVEIVVGREATEFTGVFYEVDPAIVKAMKSYECEQVSVYLVDEYGNIGCLGVNNADYRGIPVQSLFVGDRKLGGLEEPDSNSIRIVFPPNWSDDFAIVRQSTIDFNPLTDLNNAL